jgi:hypothetical protein
MVISVGVDVEEARRCGERFAQGRERRLVPSFRDVRDGLERQRHGREAYENGVRMPEWP